MTRTKLNVLCGSALLGGLSLLTVPAHADEATMEILDILRSKGDISEEQYEDLKNKAKDEQGPKITTKDKLKIESADGKFSWEFFGRMMFDAAVYDDDDINSVLPAGEGFADGTEIRRARIGMKGKLWDVWGYKAQFTIVDGANVEDLFLSYNGFNNTSIKVGQYKEPFGLEALTSSKYDTFMHESAPTQAFEPGRRVGIGAFSHFNDFTIGAGVFSEEIETDDDGEGGSYGVSGRLTYAPIHEDNKAVHFGIAGGYRGPDQSDVLGSYSGSLITHINEPALVNTGSLIDVDSRTLLGLEAATSWDRFSAQAEYMRSTVDTNSFGDLDFDGWYVQGSFFLTDDHRPYDFKPGDFDKVTPKASVGKGGYGAWELAARYETLDLGDADVLPGNNAGEIDNMTLGVNWYATRNVRFTVNYNQVMDISDGAFAGFEPASLEARAQFFW